MTNLVDITDYSNQKISTVVGRQLPAYIKDTCPNFVTFVQKLYEWTEQPGNVVDNINSLLNRFDVDEAPEEDLDLIAQEFLHSFPKNTAIDRRFLVKHILQFYLSKGSETAFRFLFRVLFDTEIEFFYPREHLLIPSGGTYRKIASLKIISNSELESFENRLIVGSISGASSIIESHIKTQEGPYSIHEFYINKDSLVSTYQIGEQITIPGTLFTGKTSGNISSFRVTNKGDVYEIGDKITVSGSAIGSGFFAEVTEVGSLGEIKHISVINSGAQYLPDDVLTVTIDSTLGTGADITAIPGALCDYEGIYTSEQSFPSGLSYCIDSDYYQKYSYVIKTPKNFLELKSFLTKLAHPAGKKLFGIFQIINEMMIDDYESESVYVNTYISQSDDNSINLLSEPIVISRLVTSTLSDGSYGVGRSLRDLEQERFLYRPNEENFIDPSNLIGPNVGYLNEFANTPASVFDQYTYLDFINTPYQRTNVSYDAIIYNHPVTVITYPIPIITIATYQPSITVG